MATWSRAMEAIKLEPIFGPKTWGADSTCRDVHPHGPMPEGSRCCCMACHKSGVEWHRALKITPQDEERLKNYVPRDEDGNPIRDQWSERDEPATNPTKYEPAAPMSTKERKKAKRKAFGKPTDPDALARMIDSGNVRLSSQT